MTAVLSMWKGNPARQADKQPIVTIQIDYNEYADADAVARNEGSTLYGEIMEFIHDKREGKLTVMRTSDDVREHYGRILEEIRRNA